MTQTMGIRVAENGRMVLPHAVRKAMGLQGDTKIILTIENDEVRLSPIVHGVARARALYLQHSVDERSTEGFLADRREEAAKDGDAAKDLEVDREPE